MEPGQNQFFSVELQWKNGEVAGSHYIFFHTKTLKSVDSAKTTVPRIEPTNLNSIWSLQNISDPRLILSTQSILGHHIWRDPKLMFGPLISDELAAALAEEKLTGFLLTPIAQV
jgi:hypothetical protein